MTGVRALPIELWYNITASLPFLDLWNLTMTCKTLYSCFSETVYATRDYLGEHYKLLDQVTCKDHFPQGSNTIGQALDLILHRELPPAFIEGIRCYQAPRVLRSCDYDWGASIAGLDNGRALRRALKTPLCLCEDEHGSLDPYIELIARSDEEAALCMLLPMLSNLRELVTFSEDERVHDFVATFAMRGDTSFLPRLEVVSSASCWRTPNLPLLALAGES